MPCKPSSGPDAQLGAKEERGAAAPLSLFQLRVGLDRRVVLSPLSGHQPRATGVDT